jgi:hypothetical protein
MVALPRSLPKRDREFGDGCALRLLLLFDRFRTQSFRQKAVAGTSEYSQHTFAGIEIQHFWYSAGNPPLQRRKFVEDPRKIPGVFRGFPKLDPRSKEPREARAIFDGFVRGS